MKAWGLSGILACVLVASLASAGGSQKADEKLDAQAREIAARQLKRFGRGYTARIDAARRLVFVSSLDKTHLQQTVDLLSRFADAYREVLGGADLPWNVAIVLPTACDYEPLAPDKDVRGFYQPGEKILISIDRGRVLLHEFTHALHHADAAAAGQNHPIWIAEGLATLFESAEITPKGVRLRPDSRLLTLQKAIRKKTLIPLKTLLAMKHDEFVKDAALCYAESRYLMLYLHERGVLREWYETYKSGYAEDASGRSALEKVLGGELSEIESRWKQWVEKLKLPWGELRSGQGRLGAQVRDQAEGVKIVGFVAGSAAEQAGRLKVGDIIKQFNGLETRSSATLVAAIRAAVAMQTVDVVVIRNGHRITIQQPLGASGSTQSPRPSP